MYEFSLQFYTKTAPSPRVCDSSVYQYGWTASSFQVVFGHDQSHHLLWLVLGNASNTIPSWNNPCELLRHGICHRLLLIPLEWQRFLCEAYEGHPTLVCVYFLPMCTDRTSKYFFYLTLIVSTPQGAWLYDQVLTWVL